MFAFKTETKHKDSLKYENGFGPKINICLLWKIDTKSLCVIRKQFISSSSRTYRSRENRNSRWKAEKEHSFKSIASWKLSSSQLVIIFPFPFPWEGNKVGRPQFDVIVDEDFVIQLGDQWIWMLPPSPTEPQLCLLGRYC